MQWSSDRNAGFSRANPQKLFLPVIIDPEYHYEAINVEAQQNNPNSLLWWMKRLIALRKQFQAFSRGSFELLQPANRKVLAFVRKYRDEQILVIANLSRFVQHVELDLSSVKGSIPVELFGRTQFPVVGQGAYPLTLGPHAFYWFELEPPELEPVTATAAPAAAEPVTIRTSEGKLGFLRSQTRELVEPALAEYLQQTTWAGGEAREIKAVRFTDVARVPSPALPVFLGLVDVEYVGGTTASYLLPSAIVSEERFQELSRQQQLRPMLRLTGNIEGVAIDALQAPEAAEQIVRLIAGQPIASARGAEIAGVLHGSIDWPVPSNGAPHVSKVTEDNTSAQVVVADRLLLKIFRQVEPGVHPEVEVGRYLAQQAGFAHAAPLVGTLHYRRRGADPVILADLQRFIVSEGTAWNATVDDLSRYFERVLALPAEQRQAPPPPQSPLSLVDEELPPIVQELVGRFADLARLLGQRTAELHRALAGNLLDAAFTPESFTPMYQRSLYQSLRNVHQRSLLQLARRFDALPAEQQDEARFVLDQGEEMLRRFQALMNRRRTGQRIRCHGNLSLTELLFTGKDFVFVDFEGDSRRSLGDRRTKRTPLTDVASMIRSLHHAASASLVGDGLTHGRTPGMIRPEDVTVLQPWAETWFGWMAATFARSYYQHAAGAGFLPATREECHDLLVDFVLEGALRELGHELEQPRPWLSVPLRAIRSLRTPSLVSAT
jgi:maltose alpha-D-glucosyltransferase/alpha-amylase